MSFNYSIYDIPCRSNTRLHTLGAFAASAAPEIRLHFKRGLGRGPDTDSESWVPYHASESYDNEDPVTLRVDVSRSAGLYRFRYSDGTVFLIDRAATNVWADWLPPLTLEDTLTYLLGPVMGFALRLRGAICLHASVVEIDDEAVGFVGPAGGGKSTIAALLATLGFAPVSDDALVIDRRGGVPHALPGYPRLRLWPDSVTTLFGSPDALPLLTPNWDKRYLSLGSGSYRFFDRPLPLGAIYYLGQPREVSDKPSIRFPPPRDALMTLIGNSSQNQLLDNRMRMREFEALGRLVSDVPVREIVPESSGRYLSDFHEPIIRDFRTLRQRAHV